MVYVQVERPAEIRLIYNDTPKFDTLDEWYEHTYLDPSMDDIEWPLPGTTLSLEQAVPVFSRPDPFLSLTIDGDIEPNPGPRTIKRTKKPNAKKVKPQRALTAMDVPRTNFNPLQSVQGASVVVRLDYEEALTDFNNTGGPIIAREYTPNDIFDIDTAILSRAIQFANYLFTLYTFGKVISIRMLYTFDNLEQHAFDVYFFASPVSLASSLGSRGTLESLQATSLLLKKTTVSEQYGKRSQVRVPITIRMSDIIGNNIQYKALDDYACTASAGPLTKLYTSFAAFNSAGTFPSGFSMRVSISLKCLFYSPRIISTLTSNRMMPPSRELVENSRPGVSSKDEEKPTTNMKLETKKSRVTILGI